VTLTDDERVLDFSGLHEPMQKLEALADEYAKFGVKRDARDFLRAFLEQMQKLLALADEFGVERDGQPGWGFLLAYQLALKHVPGFSGPPPRRGRGRPKEKTHQYRGFLASALALHEARGGPKRGAAARVARELAEFTVREKRQGRRPTSAQVATAAGRYANDLSKLSAGERFLGRKTVEWIMQKVPADEIRRRLDEALLPKTGETPEDTQKRFLASELGTEFVTSLSHRKSGEN
jgi:hypothetical protein